MQVHEAIRLKRAVREFLPKPLPDSAVQTILNAGRRAQSAKNRQQWRFIAITESKLLRQLSELGTFAGHLAGAPLGICLLTPDPAQRWSIMFDAGQSAAYMQLAAWELGIGSCLATIYEPDAARALLGFPADWHLNVAISFGYPADANLLTQPPRPGGRTTLDEVMYINRWGNNGHQVPDR